LHHIFSGSEIGLAEGPHIYQKDDFYYLLTAEGGTEYGHAVTIARSKNITGPYELHPDNPIMTAKGHPNAPFQKTGHADLVETHDGQWYIVFLTGRPLTTLGCCTLGRETGIEEIIWTEDNWPILKSGSKLVRKNIPAPNALQDPKGPFAAAEAFSQDGLSIHFQSLRIPATEDWCSLTARPGYLRLYGQESLSSLHRQSMIARRVQSFHIAAETCLDFQPENFQQMAGIVCYYNTYHWIYLHVYGSEKGNRWLQLMVCDKYKTAECLDNPILLLGNMDIFLKVTWDRKEVQFYYATEQGKWNTVGPVLDGSILSDDYVRDEKSRYRPAFTGAFVGMCCQDLSGNRKHADFKYWRYEEAPAE
jgi:xylan 1,4-beta-xylosidase